MEAGVGRGRCARCQAHVVPRTLARGGASWLHARCTGFPAPHAPLCSRAGRCGPKAPPALPPFGRARGPAPRRPFLRACGTRSLRTGGGGVEGWGWGWGLWKGCALARVRYQKPAGARAAKGGGCAVVCTARNKKGGGRLPAPRGPLPAGSGAGRAGGRAKQTKPLATIPATLVLPSHTSHSQKASITKPADAHHKP